MNQTSTPYDSTFYHSYIGESEASASAVVPHLIQLIQPSSIIDIGCGVGTWLKYFKEQGVSRLRGLDGDYVRQEDYRIEWDCFHATNLEKPARPQEAPFDLAICMEVAEHLNASAADRFVAFLTGCADIIAFSAAIPHQGGTDHRNEQWQSYWAEKFISHGFQASDLLRRRIWGDARCAYYYQQNIVLYARTGSPSISQLSQAQWLSEPSACQILDVVHPAKWLTAHDDSQLGMKRISRALPNALRMAVERRLGLRQNIAD